MVHLFTPALETARQEHTFHHGRPKRKRDPGAVERSDTEGGSANETNDQPDDDLQQAQLDPAQTTSLNVHKNLKNQHLHVLNTILHKSMLDNDYIRARRAFGILLRSQLNGRAVDLRRKGLWAIGAEILLQSERAGRENAEESDHEEVNSSGLKSFSDQSFQAAQDYYNRLSIQYPWRKGRPSVVSAQHFTLASFGVEALRIEAKADRDLKRVEQAHLDSSELEERQTTILAAELASVSYLDERLEGMVGPPWDRDAHLLRLKGDISLWLADLERKLGQGNEHNEETREHLESAKKYFTRAKSFGAELTQSQERFVQPRTSSLNQERTEREKFALSSLNDAGNST